MSPLKTLRSIEASLENIRSAAESIGEGTVSYFVGMAILEVREKVAKSDKYHGEPGVIAHAKLGSKSFPAAQKNARSA